VVRFRPEQICAVTDSVSELQRSVRSISNLYHFIRNAVTVVLLFTFPAEDHAGAWTTKSFVCCRCHNITIIKWTRSNTSSNKATDVRHVCHQVGIHTISNFTETRVVNVTRVT